MIRRTMRLLAVTQVFFGSFLCATVNQANFDNNVALYGNKTANLMELNNVTQNLNSQATEVHYEVPSFLGIRDNDVHEYLKTHHVFEELQTLWQQFQTQQKLSSTADSPAGINLTPEATTTLDLIQKTIRDTFSGEKSLIFESKKLSAFLAKAKKEKKLLMVRSTGKEDSKGNVNAGGNESISAVSPDNVAVTKAIGEVVASYFSQRSISQRLMVNDPALVDPQAPLFMPVLLQVMIGEPVDGSTKETAIPTSGVMFSREAEGRTPGVTHIQATYGHNEGVVNGTVAFDTFYIGKNLVIHPLVQIKRDRLVPASGSTLKRKANEKSMQTKPCLSVEQLQALKKCADAIETYYNEPDGMDIEFVVQQNRVFIVQARPVAHKKSEPSYLKKEFVQTSLPANKIPLIIISAGGGQIQIIDYARSVIVAETINEAYDTFLYKTNNKDGIKTVILGQMAPSMSHEVNMLRGAGKQVVYVADLGTIKTWLTDVATSPLLIDTQRELIVKFVPTDDLVLAIETMDLEERLIKPSTKKRAPTPESEREQDSTINPTTKKKALQSPKDNIIQQDLATHQNTKKRAQTPDDDREQDSAINPIIKKKALQFSTPTDTIKDGWLTHPIAKKVSIFPAFNSPLSEEQAKLLKPENLLPQATITTLINTIQESDRATANAALKTLLFHVARRIVGEKTSKKATINPDLLAHLLDVFAHMRVTTYEAYQALDAWDSSQKTPEDMVARLYPTTFLQALISQIPSKNLFVNDYSLGSLLKTEKQEQLLAEELKITGAEVERIIQYTKATHYGLTDAVQNSWKSFLKDFATVSDPAVHNDFARVVHAVTTTDILPLWLNTSFYTATQQDPKTQQKKTAQDIATTLIQEYKEAESFIAELQKKRTQLNTLTLQAWEDPAKFNKLWREFTTDFVNYFANKEFTDAYEAAPELSKLAALALMQHFVSVFDSSIKTLEASRAYVGKDADLKKVQNFKTMLDGYFSVFQQWAMLLESDTELLKDLLFNKKHRITPQIPIETTPDATLQEHLSEIKTLLNSTPLTIEQLTASPQFNVSASALGSQTSWARSTGIAYEVAPTLENYFSLIHQNLLVILGSLTKKTAIITMPIPHLFTLLNEEISKIEIPSLRFVLRNKISLIGVTFDENALTYSYNMPLQNHSTALQIMYYIKEKKIGLSTQFFGEARDRWQEIADNISLLTKTFNVSPLQEPEVDSQKGLLSFGWYVINKNQVDIVSSYVKAAMGDTLEPSELFASLITIISLYATTEQKDRLIELILKEPIAKRKQLVTELFLHEITLTTLQKKVLLEIVAEMIKNESDIREKMRLYHLLLTNKNIRFNENQLTQEQKNDLLKVINRTINNKTYEEGNIVKMALELLLTGDYTKDQKNTAVNRAIEMIEDISDFFFIFTQKLDLLTILLTDKKVELTENQKNNAITAIFSSIKRSTTLSGSTDGSIFPKVHNLLTMLLTDKNTELTDNQKNNAITMIFSIIKDSSLITMIRNNLLNILLTDKKIMFTEDQKNNLITTVFAFVKDASVEPLNKSKISKAILLNENIVLTNEQRKELEAIIEKDNK